MKIRNGLSWKKKTYSVTEIPILVMPIILEEWRIKWQAQYLLLS